MKQAHYLRFARALALAAVVPVGCTSAAPSPSPEPQVLVQADAQTAHADAQVHEPADDVDAGLPFSSGPIVPPELPASFV